MDKPERVFTMPSVGAFSPQIILIKVDLPVKFIKETSNQSVKVLGSCIRLIINITYQHHWDLQARFAMLDEYQTTHS